MFFALRCNGPNKWWSEHRDWRFHPDNIIFDARSNNIMGIIAKHTAGGYTAGDVVWPIGQDYTLGQPVHLFFTEAAYQIHP